jgi:hypothetical protein
MTLADFGTAADTLPIGAKWRGLAASPEELIQAEKALIHSTRFWEELDESAIRAEFARLRI